MTLKLGKDLEKDLLTMYNYEKLFPDMELFYFVEATQKEDVVELYLARKNKEKPEDDFVEKIAEFYEVKTARIVMNLLNRKLKAVK